MFDQMFSCVRYYNSACMMQASPVVFHSVMMSFFSIIIAVNEFERYEEFTSTT
jgi:hypothetical protein